MNRLRVQLSWAFRFLRFTQMFRIEILHYGIDTLLHLVFLVNHPCLLSPNFSYNYCSQLDNFFAFICSSIIYHCSKHSAKYTISSIIHNTYGLVPSKQTSHMTSNFEHIFCIRVVHVTITVSNRLHHSSFVAFTKFQLLHLRKHWI